MRKLLAFVGVALAFAIFLAIPEEGGQSLLEWLRGEGRPIVREDTLVEAPEAPVPEPATVMPEAPGLSLRVRLVDAHGEPLAGRRVLMNDGAQSALSDTEGLFELALESAAGVLAPEEPDWLVLGPASVQELITVGRPTLMIAPRAILTGIVQDDAGKPLSGARLHAYVPLGAIAPDELARRLPERVEARTESALDGSFRLTGLPAVDPTRIEVELEGFARWSQLLESRGSELRIVLTRE